MKKNKYIYLGLFILTICLSVFSNIMLLKTESNSIVKAEDELVVAKIYDESTTSWLSYSTLEAAIEAVPSGGTVVLCNDYTVTAEIVISKNLTIVSDNNSTLTKSHEGAIFRISSTGYTLNIGNQADTYQGLNLTNIYLDGNGKNINSTNSLIDVPKEGSLNLYSSTYVQNFYKTSWLDGAAICIRGGTFTADGVTFKDNNSQWGAVSFSTALGGTGAYGTIKNCNFYNNLTSTMNVNYGENLTIDNCNFENSAKIEVNSQRGALNITNSVFKNNTDNSTDIFGNSNSRIIYFSSGNSALNLDNCEFLNNNATQCVSVNTGAAIINNCKFLNNSGRVISGGYNATSITITDTEISNNSSVSDTGAGGALSFSGGTAIIENCTIKNNSTQIDDGIYVWGVNTKGGAIYSANTNVTIKNSEISENISDELGDQIYITGGSLTLESTTINGNGDASNSADIYINGSCALNLKTQNEINGTIYLQSNTVNTLNPSITIESGYEYNDQKLYIEFSNPEYYTEATGIYAVQFVDESTFNMSIFNCLNANCALTQGTTETTKNNLYLTQSVAKIYDETATAWVSYTTLEAAIEAATDGGTVVMCNNYVLTAAIVITKNITIVSDNNSKITRLHAMSMFVINNGYSLTIGNKNTTYQDLTLTNIYIDGNGKTITAQNCMILVGGTLNLYSGCYIQNFYSDDTYGCSAIYGGVNSTLVANGATFTNNECEYGTIYFSNTTDNASIITITNCNFLDNIGTNNGAISLAGLYNLTITDTVFSNSNIYLISESSASVVLIENCQFTKNTASALSINSDSNALFQVINCEFTNNSATAILVYSPNTVIDSCKFLNNTAKAIWFEYSNASLIVKNSEFVGNTATEQGDHIYVANGTLVLESNTIVKSDSSTNAGVYVHGNGVLNLTNKNEINGTIYLSSDTTNSLNPKIIVSSGYNFDNNVYNIDLSNPELYTETLYVSAVQFADDETFKHSAFKCMIEGYIFIQGTTETTKNNLYIIIAPQARIYVESTDTWKYYSLLSEAVEAAQSGDTIVVFSDCILSETISITKNLTLVSEDNNIITKSHTGTMFAINDGYSLTIGNENATYQDITLTNIYIDGNAQNVTSSSALIGTSLGTLNLLNGCYIQNVKGSISAIYVRGTLNANGAKFLNNDCALGTIVANYGTKEPVVNLENCYFYNNQQYTISTDGSRYATLTIKNTIFENSTSLYFVYSNSDYTSNINCVIDGCTFLNNTTSKFALIHCGGAEGSYTIKNCEFSGNLSNVEYANVTGLYAPACIFVYTMNGSQELTIDKCKFYNNFISAITGFGTISSTEIYNNTMYSSAVYTIGCGLNIYNCKIKNNTITSESETQPVNGCAILVNGLPIGTTPTAETNIKNSEICGNASNPLSSEIYIYSGITLNLDRTIIEGNNRSIHLVGASVLKLKTTNTINGNIYLEAASVYSSEIGSNVEVSPNLQIESYIYDDVININLSKPELYLETNALPVIICEDETVFNLSKFKCLVDDYSFTAGTTEENKYNIYVASAEFSVTYDLNYEPSENIVEKYASGSVIIPPQDPVRENYIFAGWYTEAECETEYTFTTMPANDVTIYAKWEKATYTITATANAGGTITPNGEATYNYLDTQTYTIVANTGYAVK
ncbi:MAG: hypothetical protein E7376_05195, partial [Clostridiales bacterium]|nr:hypothetical protein [Clostridiales bacterium]